MIEVGKAQIERMGAYHPVRLGQDVARQPGVKVEMLHSCRWVGSGAFPVIGSGDLPGRVPAGAIEFGVEQLRLFGFGKNERVPVIALLQGSGCSPDIVFTLHPLRQFPFHPAKESLNGAGQPLQGGYRRRLTVDLVAAEYFICSLPGEDSLHLGGSQAGGKKEGDGGGVGDRLILVPDGVRQFSPELGGADKRLAVPRSQEAGGFAGRGQLVVFASGTVYRVAVNLSQPAEQGRDIA